jgi:hypothetical protein
VETYPDEETAEAHLNDGLTEFSWDGLATGDRIQITWDRVWNWGGAHFKKMAYKGIKGTVVCTQFCTCVFFSFGLSVCFDNADSARLPGMLTCPEVLLSLLKKCGKVFVILFPRVPPPWPATLQCQVFDDAIKIATSLVVCFLQSQFHHRWQHHGTIFIKKIKLESPRSFAGVLSHNTPAVLHQIQAIFTKNCSSKSRLSLFQHDHPNGWSPTMGKSVA